MWGGEQVRRPEIYFYTTLLTSKLGAEVVGGIICSELAYLTYLRWNQPSILTPHYHY